ncbi:unnamed protein product [Chondrus crispus]|uniref:Uncharacterized protein n=1 Tax=Chondrus crispus TaxID=2769 RepID=R7Q876_CHOCR|nr:unnamed protein product [Chondrus crispus]XP_005714063.1 unnamed protein product [Chondrus crispus]XP_005716666.1 unnamed protein product [Chondrus crispus]CDF33319.1 unnamed protein product [Chondrus crispus]CDF34244.1 unnamed protein product [Chondrus crispus]CDF36847.1 unnamed protein product [Chondrus crispus]|eukprot:XP_005713122.1 unnamed protein product [Chondrus crispus]
MSVCNDKCQSYIGYFCKFVTFEFGRCAPVDAVLAPCRKHPQLPLCKNLCTCHLAKATQLYEAPLCRLLS